MGRRDRGSGDTGGVDDRAVFQVALRAGEVQQLYTGALPNSSDLIVRPGDRIVYSINETNKFLGRSMHGFTPVTGISTLHGFTTVPYTPLTLPTNSEVLTPCAAVTFIHKCSII